ncbi:MAG TPA: hypothetical protein VGR80_14315 [Steroidobacteraceae bacterium]|nr:hypothetical protein [Steroidobacteraceae bacterium]
MAMSDRPPASPPAADGACRACGQSIRGAWYRVNDAPVCTACTERLQRELPRDSHQAFVRGLLFGVGAAVIGFILYVGFAIATGLVIGYVSLAVGYLVGKGISLGSRGVGGRRYQIAALVLTYMAVSLAAVPIAISVHMKHKRAAQTTQLIGAPAAPLTSEAPTPQAAAAPSPAPVPAAAAPPAMSFARALGTLTLLGLASPFLELADPVHGIIGLIILLVGLRIAWRLTSPRRLEISGPIAEAQSA